MCGIDGKESFINFFVGVGEKKKPMKIILISTDLFNTRTLKNKYIYICVCVCGERERGREVLSDRERERVI